MSKTNAILIGMAISISLIRCGSGPEPISFGKDQCHYCRMTISDPRFGGELITDKGRVLKYDAAECLINHLENGAPNQKALLVISYDHPGELFPVDSLLFVVSPEYRSPMGANLAGLRNIPSADSNSSNPGPLQWDKVRKMIYTNR